MVSLADSFIEKPSAEYAHRWNRLLDGYSHGDLFSDATSQWFDQLKEYHMNISSILEEMPNSIDV